MFLKVKILFTELLQNLKEYLSHKGDHELKKVDREMSQCRFLLVIMCILVNWRRGPLLWMLDDCVCPLGCLFRLSFLRSVVWKPMSWWLAYLPLVVEAKSPMTKCSWLIDWVDYLSRVFPWTYRWPLAILRSSFNGVLEMRVKIYLFGSEWTSIDLVYS